jgi:hypothetical protein
MSHKLYESTRISCVGRGSFYRGVKRDRPFSTHFLNARDSGKFLETEDSHSIDSVIPFNLEYKAMQHPKDFINKGNIGGHYDDEDLVDIGVQFLQEQSLLQFHCRDKQRGSNLLCSCLSIFRKEEEAWEYPLAEMVARYMVFFARLSKPEQQRTVIDWIRYSLGNSGARKTDSEMRFLLPIIANADELDETDDDCVQFKAARDLAMEYRVCYSAMLTIVGYSWRFWRRCKSAACSGVLPVHGLTNRRSNHRISLEGEIELQCFFDEMVALAEPLPTRFVREITGELTTRDTNTELKQLASSFSKRGLYSAFSYEQGWAITSTAKGTVIKTSRSDELWEASGRQHTPLVSRRSDHSIGFGRSTSPG